MKTAVVMALLGVSALAQNYLYRDYSGKSLDRPLLNYEYDEDGNF